MSLRVTFAELDGVALAIVGAPTDHASALAGDLTPAERGVASLLLAGHDYRTIAERRGCALRTVANQVRAVFKKTGARSRVDLLVLATQTLERSR